MTQAGKVTTWALSRRAEPKNHQKEKGSKGVLSSATRLGPWTVGEKKMEERVGWGRSVGRKWKEG